MARLIDADALYKVVSEHVTTVSVCPTAAWARGKSKMKEICLEDIANAPTVGGWLSVNDRLPDNGQDVLVYIDDYDESRITGCNYDNGVWYDCVMNCKIVIPNITHWMPLPEPPKEDEDDAEQ